MSTESISAWNEEEKGEREIKQGVAREMIERRRQEQERRDQRVEAEGEMGGVGEEITPYLWLHRSSASCRYVG